VVGRQARGADFVDPRIERSRRVIREAALAEFAESGYGGFTIEAVATRAGVGRSTVYRLWRNKLALIADALQTLNEQPRPELSAATPREGVEHLLRHLAEALADSAFSACIPALIEASEHDHSVRTFLHRYSAVRRQTLTDTIAAGIAAGDLPPTIEPDLASLALSGAIFYRRLMTAGPFDGAQIPALIDSVLGPCKPANSSSYG